MGSRALMPLLIVVALASVVAQAQRWGDVRGLDFYNPWVAGRLGAELAPSSLYAPDADRRLAARARRLARSQGSPRLAAAAEYWEERRGLSTSPLMAALYARFTSDDYDRALRVHQLLSLAAFAATVLGVGRLLGFGALERLAALILLTTAFEPLASDLRVGNVAQIQLGALGGFLALRSAPAFAGRDVAGGALLGFAVVFKPNLALAAGPLALLWLADARWRTLAGHAAGALAGAALGVAIAAWHFGSLEVWRAWLPMLRLADPELDLRFTLGNIGPAALLEGITGWKTAPLLTLALATGAGIALLRSRRAEAPPISDTFREQRTLGLGCTLLLLGSPLVWVHYHVLAVLPFLLAFQPALHGTSQRAGRPPAGWLALAALAPLLFFGVAQWVLPAAALAGLVALGTATFYVLLLRQLAAGPPPEPGTARGRSRRRRSGSGAPA